MGKKTRTEPKEPEPEPKESESRKSVHVRFFFLWNRNGPISSVWFSINWTIHIHPNTNPISRRPKEIGPNKTLVPTPVLTPLAPEPPLPRPWQPYSVTTRDNTPAPNVAARGLSHEVQAANLHEGRASTVASHRRPYLFVRPLPLSLCSFATPQILAPGGASEERRSASVLGTGPTKPLAGQRRDAFTHGDDGQARCETLPSPHSPTAVTQQPSSSTSSIWKHQLTLFLFFVLICVPCCWFVLKFPTQFMILWFYSLYLGSLG
jgi:hypothetical protein